ncbi:Flowering-promoting factor 1-like protein 4 [Acorus calamus]|uniref:Flowering-promoting factor 1-like protein 4 n=1 Tax=Acorus calamus TaxID=4465 RepID=A0AAV9CPL7_ACOCL|nr:Flowering-promoting factor 1-like protein 4 [Acorus calamus]KAK1290801.1 Flowering-promoting factor 1-like protein 4 [Acorus calamus]
MSGVWVFKSNGVVHRESGDSRIGRRKVLVHKPTEQVVTSYEMLEKLLRELGWERYIDDPFLLQFHKRSSVHLISLPREFGRFGSVNMYDIVVKNRNMFEVRDV